MMPWQICPLSLKVSGILNHGSVAFYHMIALNSKSVGKTSECIINLVKAKVASMKVHVNEMKGFTYINNNLSKSYEYDTHFEIT